MPPLKTSTSVPTALATSAVHRPRVAIIHHWLLTMRGGERVLESLCAIFPDAEIFTHVLNRDRLSPALRERKIHTSFIQRLPGAQRLYQRYLPLMPLALEGFNLADFDIVISNDAGPVKGVLTSARALHICYCLTPMRYIWGMQGEYIARSGWLVRTLFPVIAHYMRLWDFAAAARVDEFVGISETVVQRIRKWYCRPAPVIYPPVECDAFAPGAVRDDFYLCVGQLVSYKRIDLAVQACTRLGRKLVVIGEGEETARLRKLAGPTVTIMGAQSFPVLRDHYARCRALLFPGEEDFGIVPVEAMASGAPVIAYRRGGALDTVVDGVSGLFFDAPDADTLAQAILRFEAVEGLFKTDSIVRHARMFDRAHFEAKFTAFVNARLAERNLPPLA